MKRLLPFLLIIFFTLTYLIPRLSNLSQNLEFRYDQGLHLFEVKEMVDSRHLRLLGPAVTSKTIIGRQFFIGATYYYLLAFLGIISNWSPLIITAILIIIEYIFYALFLKLLNLNFGFFPTFITAILISFSPYLIFHSYFFWNPHFLIPLSILFLIYRKNPYLSAFIWGLAFSFHYSAIFWVLPYLIFRYHYSQFKFKTLLFSLILFFTANLPFIFSELRHQFYNLKTIFLIFTNSSKSFEVTPHYFIFPLLIFFIYLIIFISKKSHIPFYLLLPLLLFYKDRSSLDRILGWNYPEQTKISQEISSFCPQNYNIAATIQGDTRFYDLRYLLAVKKCPPNPVDIYPQSKTLFLIAPPKRTPETETVWEVNSFKPFKITQQQQINDYVIFYRLEKLETDSL